MNNLKKSIMGKYNAADVDKLLRKVRNDYEECLKSQKERIFELRQENNELSAALDVYKSSEQYISGALTHAEETAQAIIAKAQQEAQHQLEMAYREAQQLRMAADGCYQRLCKLKGASETIHRAVLNVIGEYAEPPQNSNVRQFTGSLDTHR